MPGPVSVAAPACPAVPNGLAIPDLAFAHTHALLAAHAAPASGLGVRLGFALSRKRPGPRASG